MLAQLIFEHLLTIVPIGEDSFAVVKCEKQSADEVVLDTLTENRCAVHHTSLREVRLQPSQELYFLRAARNAVEQVKKRNRIKLLRVQLVLRKRLRNVMLNALHGLSSGAPPRGF